MPEATSFLDRVRLANRRTALRTVCRKLELERKGRAFYERLQVALPQSRDTAIAERVMRELSDPRKGLAAGLLAMARVSEAAEAAAAKAAAKRKEQQIIYRLGETAEKDRPPEVATPSCASSSPSSRGSSPRYSSESTDSSCCDLDELIDDLEKAAYDLNERADEIVGVHLETQARAQAAEAGEAAEEDAQAEPQEAAEVQVEATEGERSRECEWIRAPTPIAATLQWCSGKQRAPEGGNATETELSSSASSSAVSSPSLTPRHGLRLRMPRSHRVDYSSHSSAED